MMCLPMSNKQALSMVGGHEQNIGKHTINKHGPTGQNPMITNKGLIVFITFCES